MDDLQAALAERNRIMIELDIPAARKMLPQASCDVVVLLALHKARVDCAAIPTELRIQSQHWLKARGSTRMFGEPIDDPNVLPE